MLAKVTSRNQITIPKKIMNQLPDIRYFDMELKDGVIIMKPVTLYGTSLNEIRGKMDELGLTPDTVREAVEWARKK